MKRTRKRKKTQNRKTEKDSGPFFPGIQTKLAIGEPDDAYEKEADAVANKVVNQSGDGKAIQKKGIEGGQIQEKPIESITPIQKMEGAEEEKEPAVQKQEEQEEQPVQKQEEEEAVQMQEEEEAIQAQEEEEAVQMQEEEEAVQAQEEEEEAVQAQEEEEAVQAQEEEEEPIQAKSNKKAQAGKSIESKLKSSKGHGEKMSKGTLNEMEAGFGANFNDVNIHTGSEAQEMSKELGAQAFTSGNDVYFNEGKYDPNSKEGKHLLAHELTHTIQQKGKKEKSIQRSVITGSSEDLEAEKFQPFVKLEEAHDHERLIRRGSKGNHVRKLQEGLMEIGFSLPQFGADGIFGGETERSVVRFQNAFDLQVDGIVGEQTMGALDDIHSGKGINQGDSCTDKTFFKGTFFNLLQVPFFSTKSCPNITITFEHKANIHGFQSCISFDANIDNVVFEKDIKTKDKFTKTTLKFKMKNATKHHLNFTMPKDCSGLSVTIKNGKLLVH